MGTNVRTNRWYMSTVGRRGMWGFPSPPPSSWFSLAAATAWFTRAASLSLEPVSRSRFTLAPASASLAPTSVLFSVNFLHEFVTIFVILCLGIILFVVIYFFVNNIFEEKGLLMVETFIIMTTTIIIIIFYCGSTYPFHILSSVIMRDGSVWLWVFLERRHTCFLFSCYIEKKTNEKKGDSPQNRNL